MSTRAVLCAIVFFLEIFAWGDAHKSKRSQVIDFEDDVVEGVNKQPLDSVSDIAEKGRKHHQPHLYRKRIGFKTETNETLRVLRYVQ